MKIFYSNPQPNLLYSMIKMIPNVWFLFNVWQKNAILKLNDGLPHSVIQCQMENIHEEWVAFSSPIAICFCIIFSKLWNSNF